MTIRDERQHGSGNAARGIGLLLVLFVIMLAGAAAIALAALWLVG